MAKEELEKEKKNVFKVMWMRINGNIYTLASHLCACADVLRRTSVQNETR